MGSTNELRSRRVSLESRAGGPMEDPGEGGRGGDGLVAVGDVLALHVEAVDHVPEGRERLVDGLRLRHRLGRESERRGKHRLDPVQVSQTTQSPLSGLSGHKWDERVGGRDWPWRLAPIPQAMTTHRALVKR